MLWSRYVNVYNGMDDRVAVTTTGVGAGTSRYLYDEDGRTLGEYGASALDVKAETIWLSPEVVTANQPFGGDDGIGGYAPLAVAAISGVNTTAINWVHGNHLGVPLVTTDATGTAVIPTGYTLPGFPGQTRTLNDLYYNRYRDYDPSIGRYVQADPIGLGGGANDYLYADGNPVSGTDPLGLEKVDLFGPDDGNFHGGFGRERDIPGVCQVYGHMAPSGIAVWRNGRKVFLTVPADINRELMQRGCKPNQPVYFLGCQAGRGDNSIAKQYANKYGVRTVGSTRQTWWSRNGFAGSYVHQNPNRGQPGYNQPNRNDPGQWRAFGP